MKKRVSILLIFLVVFLMNLISAITINVNSPIDGRYYDTSSVNLAVYSNEVVNWKAYLDGQYYDQHNNDTQWIEPDFIQDLLDRSYTLLISATNSTANVNSSIITFYVDTASPLITSQTPENNSQKYRENVNFSVSYTEANLNYTKLYWKVGDSSYPPVDVSGCESGTLKSCSKNINFSQYSYGTNISYYFNLVDKTSKWNSSSVYTFEIIACTTSWSCTSWSSCSGGTQTRTCTKICENGTEMPSVSQTCSCAPEWSCTSWSSCSGGSQTRTCTDSKSCGTNTDKPSESQSCSDSSTTTNTNTQTENTQNMNYFLSESQFNNGSSRTLKLIGDKITFKIKNESHALELKKIFSDKVSIKISSSEQYANLSLNEVKKFELTGDRYYDISVALKRLNSSEADILINATNEKVPETVATTQNIGNASTSTNAETNDTESETADETETESFGSRITGGFAGAFENMKKASVYLPVVFIAVIAGLSGISIFMVARKKKRKKKGYYK